MTMKKEWDSIKYILFTKQKSKMKKFLLMFRHINDNSDLVLIWDKNTENWGFLTVSQLEMNFRYCGLWQLKQIEEEIPESIVPLMYRRIIKTFGKVYYEYTYIKRKDSIFSKLLNCV